MARFVWSVAWQGAMAPLREPWQWLSMFLLLLVLAQHGVSPQQWVLVGVASYAAFAAGQRSALREMGQVLHGLNAMRSAADRATVDRARGEA